MSWFLLKHSVLSPPPSPRLGGGVTTQCVYSTVEKNLTEKGDLWYKVELSTSTPKNKTAEAAAEVPASEEVKAQCG